VSVPILYHYPMSPYSEKLRLTMGLLKMRWMSAQVAAYPPREALAALVGGYRRIPVLQIGAHIYCDTRLAFAVLIGNESGYWELSDRDEALRQWAEQEVFFAVIAAASPYRAVRLLTRELGLGGLMRFARDRIAMMRGATVVQPDGKTARGILPSFVIHLAKRLREGACLSGPETGYLDLCCFHPLWMACQIDSRIKATWPLAVQQWFQEIQSLGHGEVVPATSEAITDAIDQEAGFYGGDIEPPFLEADWVTMRPTDYARDESCGVLVLLDKRRAVLKRELPDGGVVYLHFPRCGFEITNQAAA
jgi:glutathione S-transferase